MFKSFDVEQIYVRTKILNETTWSQICVRTHIKFGNVAEFVISYISKATTSSQIVPRGTIPNGSTSNHFMRRRTI